MIMDYEFNASEMTPLAAIVEAFEELAETLKNSGEDLRLKAFSDACALVSVLFDSLGVAFKFAELEYGAKVGSLAEASSKHTTLQNVLDVDVKNDKVKSRGSLSRSLRRVRQGLDLIRALFQQFVSTHDCSLRGAASTAYAETNAPYHAWAIRAAVAAGMYALPTRDQLLLKLNETDQSAEKRMRRYIKASLPIIQYIDKLYTARNITLDW
ncbi:hypothetical protein Nepgr_029355 [Nepenthes gracilis]|uniref:Glycolipid transfer protein domain-containing protein n=1 Tax=Nepenthes gracilis TaxID=150966 RepID=A0AAD3TF76_NEPGR|nr:hypothetical protein Nepgr_029355 [Nepenthes gracilis]